MGIKINEACAQVSLVRCMDQDDGHRPADILRLDYVFADPVYVHIFKPQLIEAGRWYKTRFNKAIDVDSPVTEFGSHAYIERRNLYQALEDNYDGGLRNFTLRFGVPVHAHEQMETTPTWPGMGPSH